MRIVIDIQACQTASRDRGIGRYSLALVEALLRNRRGHEVVLVLNAAFPESVETLRERFRGRVGAGNIAVLATPVPVAGFDPDNAWRAQAAAHIREVLLSSLAPDAVLVSSLFEGFVDDASTSLESASPWATAVVLYDLIPLFRPATLASAAAKSWYERKVSVLKRADMLLAISGHARTEAVSGIGMPADRLRVISTAAGDCFRPVAPSGSRVPAAAAFGIDRPFILYAGGFDERKNVPNLLAGYARLPAHTRLGHPLVLVGRIDDDDRRRLLRQCARLRIDEADVVFPGYLPDEALAALYRACRVFVFPSLHEGFGLPVLEAMSCAAPVIASRTTSIPEVVGRDDALFDPTDPSDIARLLERALTDARFREDLKVHGRERAGAFSWDRTAAHALDALEEAFRRKGDEVAEAARRAHGAPKLAYVAPLPPARTGVASYSADLLAPLARHYAIELVTDQDAIDVPESVARLPVRTTEWFDANAGSYDRILYQLGNSPFHCRMFDLIERHPGTAVLHDFHLGAVADWMDASELAPGIFRRWLYEAHGWPALVACATQGRASAADRFPSNRSVVSRAAGVIVHSRAALRLAERWCGASEREWRHIEQLRTLPRLDRREAARAALGLGSDEILVCSFGFLHETKLNHRLVAAWSASALAANARCRLVFVGENHGGDYGSAIARGIADSPAARRISITGFVDAATYDRYLLAADAAVQLRGLTRGETSRAVLDCLAHGLPLIVNATGASAELPDGVTLRLDGEFSDRDLGAALERLVAEPSLRRGLGRVARDHIASAHDPDRVAAAFRDAIEAFARTSPRARYAQALRSIASADTAATPDARDWSAAAEGLALALPADARQLLVDVSVLAKQDLASGIERVVRNILQCLLLHPPAGYRVEPVRAHGDAYVYAREFACRWLGLEPLGAGDDPIDIGRGDVFLGLDWSADIVPGLRSTLQRYRTLGVRVTFVVYDLLPVEHPEFFPDYMAEVVSTWLDTIAHVADGVVCISSAVAAALASWLGRFGPDRAVALRIGTFPLGADMDRVLRARDEDALDDLAVPMRRRPSVLMVGTVEPRKGHEQALAAFEALWEAGFDANLVIVGRPGWMVDALAQRLRDHAERGHRLFWLESASDAQLERIYAMATVLLTPSRGEGFGLPLVEAARHGVPLIVRDLPVFREVAGEHAFYFAGASARELGAAIRDWFALRERGEVPDVTALRWKTWEESTEALLDVVLNERWSGAWEPAHEATPDASGSQLARIDFSGHRIPRIVASINGLSGREHWGRWSDARLHPCVEIRFRSPLPPRGSLRLTGRAFGPNVGKPVRIRLGRHEADVSFTPHDTTTVMTYELESGPDLLEIVPPHPVAPSQLGLSSDSRELAIGLASITISAW